MIRSSALLTVVAMVMLVAGTFSANLGLIYASIAVSILAALTLGVGVLLRRRELFGAAAAGDVSEAAGAGAAGIRPPGTRLAGAGQPAGAGETAGPRPAADDRARTGRDGSGDGGTKDGGLAGRPQQAGSGAGSGSGRWPGSIAAKGASVAGRNGGEHSAAHAAGRGRSARPAPGTGSAAHDPAARGPAPREPSRGDRARTERDRAGRPPGDREPAGRPRNEREPARREREAAARGRGDREPAGREPAKREHAGSGTGRDAGWPGRDRDQAVPRAEGAPTGRDRDRDRDAAARAGREQAAAEVAPAARRSRDQGAQGQGQEAAAPRAEAFRLPSAEERAARARDDAARHEHADAPAAGDDFWDRVSDELADSGSKGPVRPAWPSTAGPRAMGAGSAAMHGLAETGDDEPEAAWSSPGYRQAEPASRGGEAARSAETPDEEDEQAERPVADEPRWDRRVPPYVDDLTRPKRDREPAGSGSGDVPAGEGPPAEEEAEAAAGPAGQDAGGAWSAWSSFRATPAEEQAAAGGRDQPEPGEQDEQRGERAGRGRNALPDSGPSGDDLADGGATAGAVTSGGAAAGGGTGEDEIAEPEPAADVAGGERDGAAVADRTDEAAEGDTEDDEAAEPDTAEAGTAEADQATGGDRAADVVSAGAEGNAGKDTAEEDRPAGDGTEAEDAAGADGNAGEAVGGAAPLDDEVTIVPGVARYHRRGCILIRFLSDGDLETMTRREAKAKGSVPCKACQPDKPDPSD